MLLMLKPSPISTATDSADETSATATSSSNSTSAETLSSSAGAPSMSTFSGNVLLGVIAAFFLWKDIDSKE